MARTLLVTGGAGFIGSNFIQYWMSHHPDDNVRNLDLLTYAGNLENLATVADSSQYQFIHGDICDPETVRSAMDGVDIVVHFAAESHVDRSVLDPAAFVSTNVLGTQVLLDAACELEVPHFHHVSTDEVFGSLELGSSEKFSENTPYDPRSPYSASKAGSDHLVRAYGETYGLPYTISNCSNNYGPYQFPEKLISLAITNLLEDKTIPLYGAGDQVRDWLYVTDHCSAIELILEAGPTQMTYVVGGLTEDITNKAVLLKIIRLMHQDAARIEPVADRPGHDERYSVDWTYIHKTLGWEPSVSLDEGLAQTIEWYQTHPQWWRPLKQNAAEFYSKNYDKR